MGKATSPKQAENIGKYVDRANSKGLAKVKAWLVSGGNFWKSVAGSGKKAKEAPKPKAQKQEVGNSKYDTESFPYRPNPTVYRG